MDPEITTYIPIPGHQHRSPTKPTPNYKDGARPSITVRRVINKPSPGIPLDQTRCLAVPPSSKSMIPAEGKFSTYPPRSASKSLMYATDPLDLTYTTPTQASARPSLTGFEFNLAPEPVGNSLNQVVPVDWMSGNVGGQLDSEAGWPSSYPDVSTFIQLNQTLPSSNPLINDYPLLFPANNQDWMTLPTEINSQGIQPIPQFQPEETVEPSFGPKPLTTQKPLLLQRPTWAVPDEEGIAGGQGVGNVKNQMMWAREQGTTSNINVKQGEQQLALPTYANDIFGVCSTGLDASMLMPQCQSQYNNFTDAHWVYTQPDLCIETGGIVPVESSKPKGPLQFKMPSALEEAIGGVSGFQTDFGMMGKSWSDGSVGMAGMGLEAGKNGTQCPSYWGGEKGGVMGSFLSNQKDATGLDAVTGLDEAGLLLNNPYAYGFQPQPQPTRRRNSMRANVGAHYQHGPILATPNSSARFQPYVKKTKPVVQKQYAAPISCPMTPPESSCFKNAILAMQEVMNNVDLQEEVEMMGYKMNENFEIPGANELLGRADSWNGGDIFELINGTVPPVVATMTEGADAPSSPDEVPLRPREQTGIVFLPELPAIPRVCASPVSDHEIPQATASSAPQLTSVLAQSPKAFKRSLTTVGDAINNARLRALRAYSTDGLFNFNAIASLDTYDAEKMGWDNTIATPMRKDSKATNESDSDTTAVSVEQDATSATPAAGFEDSSTEKSDAGTETESPTQTRLSFRLPEHDINLMRQELKHLKGWNGHALSREDDAKIRSLWLDAADRRDWHLQHRNPHTIFLPSAVQCRCCAKSAAPLLPGKPDDPPLVRRKWPCLVAYEVSNGDLPIKSKGCCLSCSLRKASCSLQKVPVTGISVVDGMPRLPATVAGTKEKGSRGRKNNPQHLTKPKPSASTIKTRSSGQDYI